MREISRLTAPGMIVIVKDDSPPTVPTNKDRNGREKLSAPSHQVLYPGGFIRSDRGKRDDWNIEIARQFPRAKGRMAVKLQLAPQAYGVPIRFGLEAATQIRLPLVFIGY